MLSAVVAVVVALALFGVGAAAFDLTSGIVIGLVAAISLYIFIVRRVGKKSEKAMGEVEGHLKGQRWEMAIKSLEGVRPLARWQPLLGNAIDAQIGMIKYAYMRDFDGARPHLEKAGPRLWQAGAMLAATHFKKKQYDDMERVFEGVAKKNKKQGMLWAVYSWCEWKRGDKNKALSVLGRGVEALPSDARLKAQQSAIANGKKPKMNAYGPEWMALHLDGTPAMPPGGQRPRFMPPPNKVGLRGRRARMIQG